LWFCRGIKEGVYQGKQRFDVKTSLQDIGFEEVKISTML